MAGDLLLGGDDPVGVYQRLRSRGVKAVRGLSDRALVSIDADDLSPTDEADRAKLEAFRETQRRVGEVTLKYLEQLPDMLRLPLVDGREVLLVHGSPSDPSIEMGHDLDDAELLALIADDPADFIVCGSSHVPFQRVLDGVHVINVGSVGAAPGDEPVAHFTTMTIRLDETTVEQDFVGY